MFSRSSRRLLLPRLGLFAMGVILPAACAAGAPTSAPKPAADAPGASARESSALRAPHPLLLPPTAQVLLQGPLPLPALPSLPVRPPMAAQPRLSMDCRLPNSSAGRRPNRSSNLRP